MAMLKHKSPGQTLGRSLIFTLTGALTVALSWSATGCRDAQYTYYRPSKPPARRLMPNNKIVTILPGVDIIWVIDNSGSMDTYQQQVIQNADLFMSQFNQVNTLLRWRIGVLSTAVGESPYIGFTPGDRLEFGTPDVLNRFRNAVARLGTSGDTDERGFSPVKKQLDLHPDFLRLRNHLAVIFVTDIDDQSNSGPVPLSPVQFSNYLIDQKDGKKGLVQTYGVLGSSDLGCTGQSPWTYVGSRYEALIKIFNGVAYPICSADFGTKLMRIGNDIATHALHPKIFLDSHPIVSSIRVLFKGEEVKRGREQDGGYWTYDVDLNAVVFESFGFTPIADETVDIEYDEDNGEQPIPEDPAGAQLHELSGSEE